MLIPGSLLTVDVEASLGLPASLVLSFVLLRDQVLVDERERLGQVLLRVRVKVRSIVLDQLPQLLLLRFPDVAALASVGEHLDVFGYLNAGLWRPSSAHAPDRHFVFVQ